jgi:hypothetical protein
VGTELLAWWVVANFQPVLGPSGTAAGCNRTPLSVGLANHVVAICQ